MASMEDLPPDQRAVLELVLRRGRSYDEIAKLLAIDRAAVRERALFAFDAIGPQTDVAPERRALITDYLLGQLPPKVADDVRSRVADSPSERAWARVLASELSPISVAPLPEIGGESRRRQAAEEAAPAVREPAAEEAATAPKADDRPSRQRREPARPASRRGGAVVLGLAALVVIAVVVVLVASGGGSSKHKSTAAKTPSTATTGTGSSRVVAQINLVPPTGASKAAGIAEVLKQGNTTGIAVIAQGVQPNSKNPPNAYAVWLYNSPNDSHILGFVNPGVGANGRLQTAGALPSNAAHYRQLLVTLETQSNPKVPGTIVLQGALSGV